MGTKENGFYENGALIAVWNCLALGGEVEF